MRAAVLLAFLAWGLRGASAAAGAHRAEDRSEGALELQRFPTRGGSRRLLGSGAGNRTLQCAGKDIVHVMYTADEKEWEPMLASMTSAIVNSEQRNRLRFLLVIPHTDPSPSELCVQVAAVVGRRAGLWCEAEGAAGGGWGKLKACASAKEGGPCFCRSTGPQVQVVPFVADRYGRLREMMGEAGSNSGLGATANNRLDLLNPINFARNYADDFLLPMEVERVVYLDADTIVQGDVTDLWDTPLPSGSVVGFADLPTDYKVARDARVSRWFRMSRAPVKESGLTGEEPDINVGVYVMDVKGYRDKLVAKKIDSLLEGHDKDPIWTAGVQQPSFVLGLAPYTHRINPGWNIQGLGYLAEIPKKVLKEAYILHWSGKRKPWQKDGLYKHLYAPYAPGSGVPLPPGPAQKQSSFGGVARRPAPVGGISNRGDRGGTKAGAEPRGRSAWRRGKGAGGAVDGPATRKRKHPARKSAPAPQCDPEGDERCRKHLWRVERARQKLKKAKGTGGGAAAGSSSAGENLDQEPGEEGGRKGGGAGDGGGEASLGLKGPRQPIVTRSPEEESKHQMRVRRAREKMERRRQLEGRRRAE